MRMHSLSVAPHTPTHCACGLISNARPCATHITPRGAGLGTLRLRLPRRVPVGGRARQGAPPVRRPAPGAPVRGVVLAAHVGGGHGARLVASLESACVCCGLCRPHVRPRGLTCIHPAYPVSLPRPLYPGCGSFGLHGRRRVGRRGDASARRDVSSLAPPPCVPSPRRWLRDDGVAVFQYYMRF